MQEVQVIGRSIDLLMTLLSAEQVRMFVDAAHRVRAAFGDRTIWHVNATSRGGGVAEMLQTLPLRTGRRDRQPLARPRR